MNSKNAKAILAKYTIKKSDYVKRQAKFKQSKDLNFDFLVKSSEIFSNNVEYYKKLRNILGGQLNKSDDFKLEKIIEAIKNKADLSQSHIDFENRLTQQIRGENPELFDELSPGVNAEYIRGCNYLVKEYNYAIENGIKVNTHFTGLRIKYEAKGVKYTSVFDTVAKGMEKGTCLVLRKFPNSVSSLVNLLNDFIV